MSETDDAPSLTLSQVRGIIFRGRWWILLAMCISSLAATAAAYLLPVSFTSEATLLVVRQQVPERYVTPTNTLTIADQLQAMTQEVLSRKRLLEVVDQFGLYAKERQRLAPEELFSLMRKHIGIDPIEGGASAMQAKKDISAFKISFSADKPILAQEVTSRLTSLFVEENLKAQEEQATTTTNFLAEQVESAKKKLTEQEERLRDFKMQNLGELPEQQQGNLAILNSAGVQLQNTIASLDRARQQRVYLESLLTQYQRLAARVVSLPAPSGRAETPVAADPVQALETELTKLKSQRDQLLSVYRQNFPDVVNIEREIAARQASLEVLKAAKAAPAISPKDSPAAASERTQDNPSGDRSVNSRQAAEEDTSIAQLKSQLESNRLEVENLSKDQKRQEEAIQQYQSRLNLTPVREQQLSGILRDYELSRQEYLDLLGKEQQSQLAMSLEKRQEGQQFRLTESPNLPTLPSSPKRLKISLGGVGVGVVLGLVLAVLADVKNPRLYDEEAASRQLSIPLVVGLPLLLTPAEVRFRRLRMFFELCSGSLLTLAILAVQYYVYRHP